MTFFDLHKQLSRQLLFLRNSAGAYDAGHKEEAVRIAVVGRVLCHDTKSSHSLLKQLGVKDTLQLITTVKVRNDQIPTGVDVAELMGGVTFGESIEYTPIDLGLPSIPCHEWWAQPVYLINGHLLCRKDVILAAANKDGGAHVDAPDVNLDALNEGFWLKTEAAEDIGKVSTPVVGKQSLSNAP